MVESLICNQVILGLTLSELCVQEEVFTLVYSGVCCWLHCRRIKWFWLWRIRQTCWHMWHFCPVMLTPTTGPLPKYSTSPVVFTHDECLWLNGLVVSALGWNRWTVTHVTWQKNFRQWGRRRFYVALLFDCETTFGYWQVSNLLVVHLF